MIVSLIGAGVLSLYGVYLVLEGRFVATGAVFLLFAGGYFGLAAWVRARPDRYRVWLWLAVLLSITIKTISAWARGPTPSNTFFYDGSIVIAVGYAVSTFAAVAVTAVQVLIQLIAYSTEVALGQESWASVLHVAPDTLLSIVLTCILTVFFRRRHDAVVDETEVQYQRLSEAYQKMEGFTAELESSNRALTEATEVRGRFLANMSHEIRTPMNAVVGMTDLLLDTEVTPKQAELASLIQQSSHSLLRVLNDILDVSKLQAGRLDVRPAAAELRAELAAATRMFETSAAEAGLVLSLDVAAELPKWVFVDAGRLGQIVLNYVSNAIKFTPSGTVRVRASRPQEGRLRVEVVDSGVGIELDQAERLFLPFEQLDASTTRRTHGTGLGLAICKQLAELMGGAVGVDSRPGAGSTFWVEIPAAACDPPPAEQPRTTETEGLARLSVLVADDSEINRRVAIGFLRRLGLEPAVARDGQDVLDVLEARGPFDVILMDCQMPRLDGYEATAKIRGNPRFSDTRIVALTASALDEDVQRSREAGMDAHLSKPYDLEQLRSALLSRDSMRATK